MLEAALDLFAEHSVTGTSPFDASWRILKPNPLPHSVKAGVAELAVQV